MNSYSHLMNSIIEADTGSYLFEGLSPLSLITDNPKGEWLENKKRYSEEDGRRVSGAFNRIGTPTAYWTRNVFLPVNAIKHLIGLNDEQNNVRYNNLGWLRLTNFQSPCLANDPLPSFVKSNELIL